MSKRFLILSILLVTAITAALTAYYTYQPNIERLDKFRQWRRDPAAHTEWKLLSGTRCGSAPFLFPTDGFAGFLWGDSFGLGHAHQGIDIFAGTDLRVTPVISAYPGFLRRLPEWKSAVIVRVPEDPLQPGRQIWLYYTHMADQDGNSFISDEFPAGTSEKFVEAGTLLGYQGNYSGDPNNPTGLHLHFSIVEDDGDGQFKNEVEIKNTIDPSPYLGLPLNGYENRDRVPLCEAPDEQAQR
ncbi:MAG TPA: M23 family metallopeptidase [Anaerolineales bacterium]|nr:M23 family metallopeptidase [Anaerolineales bacterium]